MVNVPRVKFNNGLDIPIFGLGTWKSKPGEVTEAVKHAIDVGYRHIDCAHVYGNEKEVGEALTVKFKEGVVKREDVFITSKLWNTFHRPDLVEGALKTTLSNLGLEYLDLYLIHWPMAYKEENGLFPSNEQGKIQFSNVDYVDTWKAMEKLVQSGLTKSIGLSNFNSKQIQRVLDISTIKPVNLQIESHPYLNQKKLIEFCRSKDITVTAYSPLGSPDRPWAKPGDPQLLEDPKLKELAAKYKKTPAQVVLRYQIERGVITIPKSVTKSRIEENFNIFDFHLSKEDVAYIDSFDCSGRFCPLTAALGHPHHPFENADFYKIESNRSELNLNGQYDSDIVHHLLLQPADKLNDKSVTHEENVNYLKCQLCEYITSNTKSLEAHFTAKHERAKLYQCSDCKFETKSRRSFVKHYKCQHNEKTEWHHCHMCEFKSKYKSSLSNHRRSNHDNTVAVFHCEQCEYKTKYKGSLLQHHKSKHDNGAEIFHCELCDYKTKLKCYLLRHHRIRHGDATQVFRCEVCDYKTKYKYRFLQHHKSKHDNAAEIFHCELCDYKTKLKGYLQKHYRLKHDNTADIHHCKLCEFKTKYRSSLLQHYKAKHDDAAEVFHCEQCEFRTKYKKSLLLHQNTKHNDAADILHCELCDYKTKSKYHLLDHQRSTYHCGLCEFRTKHKYSMIEHQRSKHEDSAEVFHCEQCDFKTEIKSTLQEHHRSRHDDISEVVNFKLCDFKAKMKSKLLQHTSQIKP